MAYRDLLDRGGYEGEGFMPSPFQRPGPMIGQSRRFSSAFEDDEAMKAALYSAGIGATGSVAAARRAAEARRKEMKAMQPDEPSGFEKALGIGGSILGMFI